jgi:hypothetical protein
MSKQELDDILLVNWYFIKCKMERPCCKKTILAGKFLDFIIKKVLTKKVKTSNDNHKLLD